MKKYLMMVAAVAMVACSDNTVIDENAKDTSSNVIGFSTEAYKLTRAENSGAAYSWTLFDHHTTFNVYGYKNTAAINAPVFNGDVVTVAKKEESGYKYTYTTLRYWDMAATYYEFYAAAPSGAFTFTAPTALDADGGKFKKEGVTLTGVNATETSGDNKFKYVQSFKGKTDVDLMIAAPCKVTNTVFKKQPVTLNFIHVLSRLNIIVKNSSDENVKVTITGITVNNLYTKGNFNEGDTIPTGKTLAGGTYARWSNLSTTGTYTADTTTTSKDEQYVLQSLVIPQPVVYEKVHLDGKAHEAGGFVAPTKPYIKVDYKLDDESFTAYYNLAAAFGMDGTAGKTELAFNEGWQNTLTITFSYGSDGKIDFCGNVAEWSSKTGSVEIPEEKTK